MSIADVLEATVRSEYQGRLRSVPKSGAYILVLGGSSSGKTTAIERYVGRHPDWTSVYDSAFLKENRFKYYHHQLFALRDPSFYLAFQSEALLIRFLQNEAAGERTICDQSIHSIWAYSRVLVGRNLLSNAAYQSFFAAFLTFRSLCTLPSLVLRLTCDAQIARARVVARERAHEQTAYTTDFITELNEAYGHVVQDFPTTVDLHSIDTTSLSLDQTQDELEAAINAHQRRRGIAKSGTIPDGR